jgi:glycerophosphoryl diester phosphodiesterase
VVRRIAKLGAIVVATLAAAFFAVAYLVVPALAKPVPAHPFWDAPAPRVIAHRGGRGLWPENTLYAFRRAAALGVDVLEMDLRESADGEIVVLHDATVDRTTDGSGPVAALALAELARLDAGFRWTPDGGGTYPYRGRDIRVPALKEVFQALPQSRMNLEMKSHGTQIAGALCALLRAHGMERRVVVASMEQGPMDTFRSACPRVATAATRDEVIRFARLSAFFLAPLYEPRAQVLQVPERVGGYEVLTPGFARGARRLNLKVEVWTINEPAAMQRLVDLPVDGVMTDYPDRLIALLKR